MHTGFFPAILNEGDESIIKSVIVEILKAIGGDKSCVNVGLLMLIDAF